MSFALSFDVTELAQPAEQLCVVVSGTTYSSWLLLTAALQWPHNSNTYVGLCLTPLHIKLRDRTKIVRQILFVLTDAITNIYSSFPVREITAHMRIRVHAVPCGAQATIILRSDSSSNIQTATMLIQDRLHWQNYYSEYLVFWRGVCQLDSIRFSTTALNSALPPLKNEDLSDFGLAWDFVFLTLNWIILLPKERTPLTGVISFVL